MIIVRLLLLLLSARLASADPTPQTPEPTTGIQFRGFDCFNAQTRRVMQPTLCDTSSSPMPKPTQVLIFDLFQLPTDTPLKGKGCSLRISQITGRCSMWSHYEFVSPPSFLSPTTLQASACQQLWDSRQYHHDGSSFALMIGRNEFSYVSAGGFTTIDKGQLSCVGQDVHWKGTILKSALILVQVNIDLFHVDLLQSLKTDVAVITNPREYRDVILSKKDMENGQLALPDVTFLVPAPPIRCPLIPLRRTVNMTQLFMTPKPIGTFHSEPLFSHPNVHPGRQRMNISGIVWTSPALTLQTRSPHHLPASCGTTSFYSTSHPEVLVCLSTELADNIQFTTDPPRQTNPAYSLSERLELQLLTLSSQLVHLHDTTVQLQCSAQSFMGAINFPQQNDTGPYVEHKLKIVPMGESLLLLFCPLTTYYALDEPTNSTTPTCTHELLVRDASGDTRYLTPVHRYARKTPTTLTCPPKRPDANTAHPLFISDEGQFYSRSLNGHLQLFNAPALFNPFNQDIGSDTAVYFSSQTDPYMTVSQNALLDSLDPIQLTAVRSHMSFQRAQSIDTVGHSIPPSVGGAPGPRGHSTWDALLYNQLATAMGTTFVLPIFSSLLNMVKILGNIGGSIFMFQLAAKLCCAYMCPYWPRPGQNILPPATAALVREEVEKILHERRGALHTLHPLIEDSRM